MVLRPMKTISTSAEEKLPATSSATPASQEYVGRVLLETAESLREEFDRAFKTSTRENENRLANLEKQLQDTISSTEKKITQNRINVIGAIGIFVALLTFISTNITIFSRVPYLSTALWFMILMLIGTLVLLSAFLVIIHKPDPITSKYFLWFLIPASLLAILIASLLLTLNNEKLNPPLKPDNIKSTSTEASSSQNQEQQ